MKALQWLAEWINYFGNIGLLRQITYDMASHIDNYWDKQNELHFLFPAEYIRTQQWTKKTLSAFCRGLDDSLRKKGYNDIERNKIVAKLFITSYTHKKMVLENNNQDTSAADQSVTLYQTALDEPWDLPSPLRTALKDSVMGWKHPD